MVKRASRKWRMCVDFTDLNRACPKDSYPLLRVDVVVDSTAQHQLLSFMDAFSGYNQIQIHKDDQEKTSRDVSEAYEQDVRVANREKRPRTFNTLRSYNMKLNPGKCAFGVTTGKFLGFMVSQKGIEANPDKIRAIMEMAPPRNVKEVQNLNGKIAALNRFVLRATDKCLPFFRTLKKSFEWTADCQQAFEELKAYLSSPPLLSPSQLGEELFLYLAVSPAAVSTALIREEERVQKPVYYASQELRGAEERYPPMEKLAFALVMAARKLKPYFQTHTMIILTDKPLRQAMSNPEAAGRLALWAIELSEFDIQYRPRTAIKGQIVSDFIVEFTSDEGKGAKEFPQWSIHTDGSSNRQARGVGVVLLSPEGDMVECMVRLDFPTTNNEAEYKALMAGFDLVKAAGVVSVIIYCNSQVITNQVNGDYECKNERMKRYLDQEIGFESNWTTPLVSYLKNGVLLDRKEAARKLKVQAARFVLIKDILTTARTPTGETPFRQTFGSEAVIPAEVRLTSYKVHNYDDSKNDEAMHLQLDLVDEVRVAAEQRLARYQDRMAKHYNSQVRRRDFQVGDLVLRRVMGTAKDPTQGKLDPNWEGPYRITLWQRKGTYHLETLDGQKLPHPWNTKHLQKYYQ
ncbi:uncharacterized protein LOC126703935 [Quercus robur]|uniref:uncharacterized protein LOC126703935 n=1 Tax=Quercus robur TaxID=38942 RepID=UPI002163DD97|nr:uncharacterized protein LOC126703935 [Quercus robur]